MTPTFERVRQIASTISGIVPAKLTAQSAIDQDLGMSGDDVTDFAQVFAEEFGDQILQWRWQRFACLGEGLSPLFPFVLLWQFVPWPFRGSFSYPSPYERLTLSHIAKVIAQGHWSEP